MADIYLGPTISGAILLPPIRWGAGNTPGMPSEHSKTVNRASVLSGATRFDIRPKRVRRWQIGWEFLKDSDLATLVGLDELNRTLWLQNGWEGGGWRRVGISRFEYGANLRVNLCGGIFWPTIYGIAYYGVNYYEGFYTDHHPLFAAAMTLEEAT